MATENVTHDLLVIGAGPGGYIAAIRAAQLGLDVGCVEKESALGGTCLRVGCIPSKALLESSEKYAEAKEGLAAHGVVVGKLDLDLATMQKRRESVVATLTSGVATLFEKDKVRRHEGHARFTGEKTVVIENADGEAHTEITAKHIIVATGSSVVTLPDLEPDGGIIGTSTEALEYDAVPKHLVVIGAGYIGLELGSVWARLGAEVTVVDMAKTILGELDKDLVREAKRLFEGQGLTFKLGVTVDGVKKTKKSATLTLSDGETLSADKVLVAVGRKPNTAGLDLDAAGVELDDRGRIAVDDHYATNVAGIYAVGDVIVGPMLAHKAEEEGIACVEQIVNGYGHVDYDAIPAVVYTHPEIATVGKTEQQLKAAKIPFNKGVFRFRANGRAHALGQIDGRVKVLAHKETDRVLGVHIIGPRAGDLIAEAATAMAFGASAEDIARACHAHPTLAEAFKEACLAVDGRAIHGG